MKFRFKIQQYQSDAVESVVRVFRGQHYSDGISYVRDLGEKKPVLPTVMDQISMFPDPQMSFDEIIDDTQPYEIFDPEHIWKRKIVTNFRAVPLMVQLFDKGVCVYDSPSVEEMRTYCKEQMETMWDEVLRFENPHKYYVDLSQRLWDQKICYCFSTALANKEDAPCILTCLLRL